MGEASRLDPLVQSFLDLWHHVDAIQARRFEWDGPLPVLAAFDDDGLRQHAVAARSIEGAVLDLDLDSLDEEIDRTVLLAAIRPLIRQLERDHPENHQPTFWTERIIALLAARTGDEAGLVALPGWVDSARVTLIEPPLFALQVALDDLSQARAQLERPEWWQTDKNALAAAVAAIDGLEQFFRHGTTPNPGSGALGEEAITWHLNHGALIEVSATEAARRLRRRLDGASPAARVDLTGAVQAYRQALAGHRSGTRRRIASPVWLGGFALFVAEVGGWPVGGAIAEWCGRGLVDVGYHLGLVSSEGLTEASGAVAAVRSPLETMETALLAIEWETVRGRFGGDTESFVAAVVQRGLFHPALAAWRLGLG